MVATPYTMPTITAGMLVGNAELQAIVDGIDWNQGTPQSGKTRRPFFNLQQTVAQSLADSTYTGVLFNAEVADTDNGHSTSSNTSRYVCQTAGTYNLFGSGGIVANGSGNRHAEFRVNGTTSWWNSFIPNAGAGTDTFVVTSGPVPLAVGDYVELVVRQTSGGAINTSTALSGSRFAGYWQTL